MTTPILISNLTNIRYLSGVDMTAGVMLLTRNKRLLFVDDRYAEKAREGAKGNRGMEVRPIGELEEEVKRFKRVRFEAEDVTVARLKRWRKRFWGTRLVPSVGVIEEMRRQKKPHELKAIAKACKITDRIIETVRRNITVRRGVACYAPTGERPCFGITEKQLAWEIEKLAHGLGADAMAFDTIVAFGSNTSRPHHRPTKRKLKKGDLIQIDMGVKVDGYCSDCSRVFFTGKPTEEQRRVHDLLVSIVRECTKRAEAGTTNHTLDKLARTTLKKSGYGKEFLHGLGHGVGLEIHEGVSLTSRKGANGGARHAVPLRQNEVITIEPGVYFEEKWGMRIEDTVVVRRSGAERLTTVKYRNNGA